jgi:hypothetical protein
MGPRVNFYTSLVCDDYYSEKMGLGLSGPLQGGTFPLIEIGRQNGDCRVPEVPSIGDVS